MGISGRRQDLVPKHYTVAIPGKKSNNVLCNQPVSLLKETKSTSEEEQSGLSVSENNNNLQENTEFSE